MPYNVLVKPMDTTCQKRMMKKYWDSSFYFLVFMFHLGEVSILNLPQETSIWRQLCAHPLAGHQYLITYLWVKSPRMARGDEHSCNWLVQNCFILLKLGKIFEFVSFVIRFKGKCYWCLHIYIYSSTEEWKVIDFFTTVWCFVCGWVGG